MAGTKHNTTILFFTSPIGLGHASRDSAIAEQLRKDVDVIFVSGGVAASFLSKCGHTVLDVYTPPKFDIVSGHLRHKTLWLIRYMKYHYRCRRISLDLIKRYNPKMIVSDEDFAALAMYTGCKVLITDVLQSRFTKGISGMVERRLNHKMTDMILECDAVITPNITSDHKNIHNVGPIVRQIHHPREYLRQKYNMRRKTVLVTVGGTEAGKFLLDAMRPVAADITDVADTIFVGGPILGDSTTHLHQMIYAADVVVSLAGRSTMDEATSYGTPGIFIPISGHFEQEDNAEQFGYTHADIHNIHNLVLEKLRQPRPHNTTPSGAGKAAQLISGFYCKHGGSRTYNTSHVTPEDDNT